MYEKFARGLTKEEMKMWHTLCVSKLDHIQTQHIRNKLLIKETIIGKVKNERSRWFAKVRSRDETNVARKTLSPVTKEWNRKIKTCNTIRAMRRPWKLKQPKIKRGKEDRLLLCQNFHTVVVNIFSHVIFPNNVDALLSLSFMQFFLHKQGLIYLLR